MSQGVLVAVLALRELWMTFRLVLLLGAFVGGTALVVLVPAVPFMTLEHLAVGLGAATVVTAAVAAWTLAAERAAGRAGWLVTRSVSRRIYLGGWFAGLVLVAVAGVAAAGLLGWLSAGEVAGRADSAAFAVTFVGIAATVASAIALALAAGALLPALPAAVVATAACVGLGLLGAYAPAGSPWWPGSAITSLGGLDGLQLGDALRAAGAALLWTAALLVAAVVAMERAEL